MATGEIVAPKSTGAQISFTFLQKRGRIRWTNFGGRGMREVIATGVVLSVVFMFALQLDAQLAPVAQNRTLTASAMVGNDSHTSSASAPDFGPYTQTAAAMARMGLGLASA